jgi:predicted MPP superfamily phosphohydrolase
MRKRFAVVILAVAVLFGALNYYIGLRGWQWLQAVLAPGQVSPWIWWLPFWIISFAFLVSRVPGLPRSLRQTVGLVGSYWLLIFLYALPLLLLVDIGRVLAGWLGFGPGAGAAVLTGWVLVLLIAGSLVYGVWRARNPVVVTYNIEIPKRGPDLHIVLVSDTHFGNITGMRPLRHMVQMVNDLKPDLILHGGDLIDDDLRPFLEHAMAAELRKLKSRLGTYSILGNHDYHSGNLGEFQPAMEAADITLLVDEAVKLGDSFYLIGRDDISGRYRSGRARKSLPELLEGVDRSRPLILMDHQPYHLEEAEGAGIDLQVSGHTHRGQMFPNNLITGRHFELDWGYLKKGALHVVVSLGFGTWGPPVRIGNTPEVVSIRVRCTGAAE